jgi:probable rRNA maturation factor
MNNKKMHKLSSAKLPPVKLSLAVQYASEAPNIPMRAQFRRWAKAALLGDVSLTLRVVDEVEGRELNKAYRGKGYPTNVLTFVLDDEPLYGDVIICAPVVEREAREQRKELLAHYAHMTIHALLHLQGYDHESDDDAAEMEALETKLMLELRYPDPYQES